MPAVDVVLRQLCACQLALVLWPAVESLFQALCDASALNPDSDMEEEAGAQLFFDEAEVRGAAICWPEGCSTPLGAGPSGGCVPALLLSGGCVSLLYSFLWARRCRACAHVLDAGVRLCVAYTPAWRRLPCAYMH